MKKQEKYFQTNLRELIGLMKRRSSKTKIQEYCRKHADRISRMDVATYDMICVMLNLKELQDKKKNIWKTERRVLICAKRWKNGQRN
ncbi:hypothetical protein DXD76_11455 [Firmicutes bacterium TM09-10]|nr:hypothetical protein DXD76_11455 [Firmicutes bacterium TM09-10]